MSIFGNGSNEGVKHEDPWSRHNNQDYQREAQRERRVTGANEAMLEGGGQQTPTTPRVRVSTAGEQEVKRGKKATKSASLAVVVFVVIGLVISIIGSIIDDIGGRAREPIPPDSSIFDGFDDYDSFREYLEEYYSGGISSGVNYLDITDANPDVSMNLLPASGEKLSLQAVYEKCAPSIVAITAYMDGMEYSWGSGIVLTEDGYIITNSHVLDDADKAVVTLSNDEHFTAKLVGYDSISDIAVLKIPTTGLVPAEFADSSTLAVGDDVVAIGNPLGEELRGTMTNGIVSAINRDIYLDGNYMTLIQTNAAINGGNSGGALIDMSGRVIGITNMKMVSYYTSIEGIGFAIPTGTAKEIVDQILDTGFVEGYPGIGITVGSIPKAVQDEYDLPIGLYVSEVVQGSGADRAGITAGCIVMKAFGVDVSTNAELNEMKSDLEIGEYITLTIWEDGEVYDVDVEIMDMNRLYK